MTQFDVHSPLAISRIVNVVSQSGSTLVVDVTPGDGALFHINQQLTIATLSQSAPYPVMGNSMIARLTTIATDRFTIDYSSGSREGTSIHTVQVGDYISNSITPKALTDIEAATGGGGGPLDVTGNDSIITLTDINRTALILKATQQAVVSKTPDQVTGLKFWLKADSLSLSNGSPVPSWTDSSGNGNTVTQSTPLLQPTYNTNILNGHPAVLFDGIQTVLENLSPSGFPVGTSAPFTMFMIVNTSDVSSQLRTSFQFGNPIGDHAAMIWLNVQTLTYTDSGINNQNDSFGLLNASTFYLPAMTYDGSIFTGYLNGVLGVTNGSLQVDLSYGTLEVGASVEGSLYWQGYIAEIVLYNRVLTLQERYGVQLGLGTKYGLTVPTEIPQQANILEIQDANGSVIAGISGIGHVFGT